MKHLNQQHERYLAQLVESAGLPVPASLHPRLLEHLDWVLEQNRTMNLTSITEPFNAVRLHVLDSLEALPEVNTAPAGVLLDLGTGAGFPGFPLCVVSGRAGVLLDSVSKKVSALGKFLEKGDVDLQIAASVGRAEELEMSKSARFAVVTARAVSGLPSLVELASPLLVPGGMFIAMKAAIEEEELRRGDQVASLVGMKRTGRRPYDLPVGDEARTILTYRRTGDAGVALPRRVGMAQKKPLA